MSRNPQLTFLGGAGTVTGSKTLLSTDTYKILIDCGLFQGIKEHRELNWKPFPVDPKSLDAIVLTHAHLDHTGYIPVLTRDGFTGPIYCSAPTIELTKLILQDSARIQMEDAEYANETHTTRHAPALPLYNTDDVNHFLPQLKSMALDEWQTLIPNKVELRLSNSGHILGSTFLEFRIDGKILAFSGDLGREKPLLLHPRKFIPQANTLVLESTYGDRCHLKSFPKDELEVIINRAFKNGGSVLIPSFAIGRAQDLLYLLQQLKEENKIPPSMQIYLDSPMADRATHIFDRFPAWHTLREKDIESLTGLFKHVSTFAESNKLCNNPAPAIIIAGSGMLNGGRIRHHLAKRLPQAKHEVVLVGYQAAGTPGRFLKEGAAELKLFGEYVPVNARISELSSLSAHADQSEILKWIKGFKSLPDKIYLNHGEPQGTEGLRVRLTDLFREANRTGSTKDAHESHKNVIPTKMGESYPCF